METPIELSTSLEFVGYVDILSLVDLVGMSWMSRPEHPSTWRSLAFLVGDLPVFGKMGKNPPSKSTLPETNSKRLENRPPGKGVPIGNHHF